MVNASYGDMTGTSSGILSGRMVALSLATDTVVPEYNIPSVIIALTGGMVAYLCVRK